MVHTVNIQEAQAQLPHLVDLAARGESFVIARAGKPLVRVTSVAEPAALAQPRLGFLAGQIEVPEDFDRMGAEVIAELSEPRVEAVAGHPSAAMGRRFA